MLLLMSVGVTSLAYFFVLCQITSVFEQGIAVHGLLAQLVRYKERTLLEAEASLSIHQHEIAKSCSSHPSKAIEDEPLILEDLDE